MRYPTPRAIMTIENWKFSKDKTVEDFLEYICNLWTWKDGYALTGKRVLKLYLFTGWRSENEEIIEAMQHNRLFWWSCWRQSKSGGHYWFKITPESFNTEGVDLKCPIEK